MTTSKHVQTQTHINAWEVPVSESNLFMYMRLIGNIPALSKHEELELGFKVKAGRAAAKLLENQAPLPASAEKAAKKTVHEGLEACGELVSHYLKFIVRTCQELHQKQGRCMDLADLIAEGNAIAFAEAWKNYNPDLGFKFSTFIAIRLKNGLKTAVYKHGRCVRLPEHVIDGITETGKARKKLTGELGRVPSRAEVADAIGTTAEKVAWLEILSLPADSLDRVIDDGQGGGIALGDTIANEHTEVHPRHGAEREELATMQALMAAVDDLMAARSKKYVRGSGPETLALLNGFCIFPPATLAEVGKTLGITGAAVGARVRNIRKALVEAGLDSPEAIAAIRDRYVKEDAAA